MSFFLGKSENLSNYFNKYLTQKNFQMSEKDAINDNVTQIKQKLYLYF